MPHPARKDPEHIRNETLADCIATLRIRDEIDGEKDVVIQAVEQLIKDMIKLGFPVVTRESRKANIFNCLQNNKSADALIEGVLRHRKLK